MRSMTEPDSLELSAPLRGLDSERIVAITSASNTSAVVAVSSELNNVLLDRVPGFFSLLKRHLAANIFKLC